MEFLEQKIVDLGKQIQELKVQINHLSCAQGEEAEIQYKSKVEKLKTVRLELESRVQSDPLNSNSLNSSFLLNSSGKFEHVKSIINDPNVKLPS